MISIPVAVHQPSFKWQLDLFWHNHQLTYGAQAAEKAMAIIIKRNEPTIPKVEKLEWDITIPYRMCEAFFDYYKDDTPLNAVPLNIQVGLLQIIDMFNDDQVIEVLDCDMAHIRHHPFLTVRDDQIIVDDIYEAWHLKSLSTNKSVIDIYFENGGRFYNGGFVPIIGKVKTFKKILPEWISIHKDIAKRHTGSINWWAGMYALQAACEKRRVRMLAEDWCYIPSINTIKDSHYIVHYSCSQNFDKKKYPDIDVSKFENNVFFHRLRTWPNLLKI